MRNPFRRKRLDREALVAGLSPEVAACWPPFWVDYDMDDAGWLASFNAWSLGIEKWLLELRINPDPARAQTREVINRTLQRFHLTPDEQIAELKADEARRIRGLVRAMDRVFKASSDRPAGGGA